MSKKLIAAITSNCMVSDATAQDIIDYRAKMKKPLTVRAATALAKEIAKCAEPETAIDYWMNRGWQGFRHDWYAREEAKQRSTGNQMIDTLLTGARH